MEKLLYLTPHLSTGGQPQYLLKKIESLIDNYEIHVIEWENTGGSVYVVQRDKIKNLLGNRFYCVHGNGDNLLNLIELIQPDIIHLEEIPEMWLDAAAALYIYREDRPYKLFETSHDSSFDVTQKYFLPDKFLFVSQWQIEQYKSINVPAELVEYPIEYKNQDTPAARQALGLDPNLKHVIHVGLWTPRKNQAELLEYARMTENYPIQYHFIGNQAGNYQWYWQPLMQNLPSNVKVWGERSDVDLFYSAADAMVFTSRGTNNDKETMPLVIREAIGYTLPILIYNLPVYLNYFDKYSNVSYLEEFLPNENVKKILSILGLTETNPIKKSYFDYFFDPAENKITLNHKQPAGNYLVSVKDIDSKACIWSFTTGQIGTGHGLWVVPKPKSVVDFQNDPLFGGFTIEAYLGSNLVETHNIRLKDVKVYKPEADITNDQPIWDNYNEFFVERIYDRYIPNKLDVVFDIGANVGLFTKYIQTKGARKVYAFEPNKVAFTQLQHNYENDTTVSLMDKAIAGEPGELWFYTNKDNSLVSALHGGIENGSKDYKVTAITLDTFRFNIDLVKIDVEGAEFDIIEKLDVEMARYIKAFLIEHHDFYFEDGEQKVLKMIERLTTLGYKVERPEGYKFIFASK